MTHLPRSAIYWIFLLYHCVRIWYNSAMMGSLGSREFVAFVLGPDAFAVSVHLMYDERRFHAVMAR